jgi:acyl-CoA thioesterase
MPSENSALKDKFAQNLGMEVLSCEEGKARVKLAVQPHFLNGAGLVHGGVLFSLADYAFALASNAGEDSGLAVNANINFIKACLPQDELFAEARLVSRSRKLGTYQIDVTNQHGDTVARIQSLAYFKEK